MNDSLVKQLRQVVATTWRVTRPNPLRIYVIFYGWLTRDQEIRARVQQWVIDAKGEDA